MRIKSLTMKQNAVPVLLENVFSMTWVCLCGTLLPVSEKFGQSKAKCPSCGKFAQIEYVD